MLDFLGRLKHWLWTFVELSFLVVLSLLLVFLLLGKAAGPYVVSVADNVTGFVNALGPAGLVGVAIVLALVYFARQRGK